MQLTKDIIISIIDNEDYGVCYEPIINVKNMEVFGYEASSRFTYEKKDIEADIFFRTVHEDLELFFDIESIIKSFQITHRPKDEKLFIKLDPDIAIKQTHMSHWIDLFSLNNNIVLEVIENSNDENVEHVENFIDWMSEYNIEFAYDDFLKPNCLFVDSLLKSASTIKLDINFIRTIRENKAYIEVAKGFVSYAHKSNKRTIMEGIESEADLEIAKEIGVDYVKGYLFKKKFITKWKDKIKILSNTYKSQDLQINKKTSNIELDAIRYSITEYVTAVDFINELDPTTYDKIEIFFETIDLLFITLYEFEDPLNNTKKLIDEVIQSLKKFNLILTNMGIFDVVANSFALLIDFMKNLKHEIFDYIEKRILFSNVLQSVLGDIEKWINVVFMDKNTDNIHYFDASFADNCLTIENLFIEVENTFEDSDDDLEFF